jgi:hypothetical protein
MLRLHYEKIRAKVAGFQKQKIFFADLKNHGRTFLASRTKSGGGQAGRQAGRKEKQIN